MRTKQNYLTRVFTLVLIFPVVLAHNERLFAQQYDIEEQTDLFEMPHEDLMDIEVTTTSKRIESIYNAPSVASVITEEDIRMFGAKNLLDVLNQMPSVDTTGSYMFGQNITSIRGDLATHHNNHTLVLINGRPVRESIQGGLHYPIFTAYPIEMIERIELVRGPDSVLYGTNAFTGVINIITKNAENSELNLTAKGGSFGYYSDTISGGKDSNNLNFYGTLHQASEDGAHWLATDEASTYGSLSSKQSSESTVTNIQSGPIRFDLFFIRQEMNHFGRAPLWSLAGNEVDTKRLFADLGYTIPLNSKWHLEPHITFNYNRFVIETGDLYHQSRDVLGEIILFGRPDDRLDVVRGYTIEHLASPHSDRSSIYRYSQVNLNAYAQAGYKIFDNTKLIGGIQWNEPEDGDSDSISHFGAIIDITDNWGIKLLNGEAFRAPRPGESLISNPVLVGNPDLKPEKIKTHDIQLFHNSQKTHLAVTYFHSTMEDMITRYTSVSPPSYMYGGEVDFWGLEFEGKHYLNEKLYVLGSVTHKESREDSGINPSIVPNSMGKLGFGYHNEQISVGLFYTNFTTPPKISGAAEVNPDPNSIHWLSANLNYDITNLFGVDRGKARLLFSVENLLDQDVYYLEFNRRNINSLPRASDLAVCVGLRYEF